MNADTRERDIRIAVELGEWPAEFADHYVAVGVPYEEVLKTLSEAVEVKQ